MRLFLVLLLVALVVLPESDAWGRRWLRIRIRGRRILRAAGRVYRFYNRYRHIIIPVVSSLGKRNADDIDKNKDGNIDQSEAEQLMERQAAEDLLSLADENGDSNVSVEEFSRSIHDFMAIDADPALQKELREAHEDAFEDDAE
ncbi:uncharacterized protein LOC124136079 [Haliotis rufescens]|uniref:uncharacterized protein LOC124136079 n=1 Tax=Haliotis rufescens TaxID=6454 RepID=UPI001EB02BD8|nr:uncharacterized protein LOC124136079 [Haliotis rufescens]XP_048239071.1 uncharacterized protein LOC124136079 [Haliotis rufescens]